MPIRYRGHIETIAHQIPLLEETETVDRMLTAHTHKHIWIN